MTSQVRKAFPNELERFGCWRIVVSRRSLSYQLTLIVDSPDMNMS